VGILCLGICLLCSSQLLAQNSASNGEVPLKQSSESSEHARNLVEIEAHLERNIGPIASVLHEVVSDHLHIDVFYLPATKQRPYALLVTSGASDYPMTVPGGMEEYSQAEYLIALPESWKISSRAFQKEKNYWPVRWTAIPGLAMGTPFPRAQMVTLLRIRNLLVL